MRKILIVAILLMLLVAPALANKKWTPNSNSDGSTAYLAIYQDYLYCGDARGYGQIGVCASEYGGPHYGSISPTAHNWRGP